MSGSGAGSVAQRSLGLSEPLLAGSLGGEPATSSTDVVNLQGSSQANWFPEDQANCISLLLFWWVLPLLNHGVKHNRLVPSDLPSAAPVDRVQVLHERFQTFWGHQLNNQRAGVEPSLWRALYQLVKGRFIFGMVPTFFITLSSIGTPLCMNGLVRRNYLDQPCFA